MDCGKKLQNAPDGLLRVPREEKPIYFRNGQAGGVRTNILLGTQIFVIFCLDGKIQKDKLRI